MKLTDNSIRTMPDIANDAQPHPAGELDWVGMDEIELPVQVETDMGNVLQTTARLTAFVNLNRSDVRGIHMSRLYLHLDKAMAEKPLSPCNLRQILRSFLESHPDSRSATASHQHLAMIGHSPFPIHSECPPNSIGYAPI